MPFIDSQAGRCYFLDYLTAAPASGFKVRQFSSFWIFFQEFFRCERGKKIKAVHLANCNQHLDVLQLRSLWVHTPFLFEPCPLTLILNKNTLWLEIWLENTYVVVYLASLCRQRLSLMMMYFRVRLLGWKGCLRDVEGFSITEARVCNYHSKKTGFPLLRMFSLKRPLFSLSYLFFSWLFLRNSRRELLFS